MDGEQKVNSSGDNNVTTVVGGSIYGDITILREETDFFEPNIEPFRPPRFISPSITPQLIEIIRQNRLLVLGGSDAVDKSALIRHFAWYISENDQQALSRTENKILILEWNRRSSDLQNIEARLYKTSTTTIFILPNISPQDINYDITSIKKAADKYGHYVLISTDIPNPSWKLPKDIQHFWQDIPENLYSFNELTDVLISGLIEVNDSLPKGISGYILPDNPLIDSLSYRDVARELRTPVNISRFITLLCAERNPLQLQTVIELIKDASDKRRTLERWYPALNYREQILALGLSFFDGLFDDQFFAAIDKVVEKAWQRRDSSLCALDYCDLDKLRNFFDFSSTKSYGIKIESRIPEQRRMLFEVAWNSHRRMMLAALPVMTQLVANSVANRSNDPELYGSLIRRDQLRMVISETLSDISLISLGSVQPTLMQLAADDNLGVQAVVARSMARWRKYGLDRELFEILKKWYTSPSDHTRATVALAVSYAARYDSQNELNYELRNFLLDLAKDRSPLVRNRFCNHTLPNIIPWHLNILQKTLHDMTQYADLVPEIAKNLALAYRYADKDVIETLRIWHQECRSLKSAYNNSTEINLREKLLATVALTYGLIIYDESGIINANEAFNQLQSILAEEKHPYIRQNVVIAISHQARNDFMKVESQLQKLMIEVVEGESNEIIQILKSLYLEQRQKLEFSMDFWEVDGKQYPIWVDSERPLTDIEKAMLRWIKTPNNPAAQQIALRALITFADALDQKEENRILEIREQRKTPITVELQPKVDAISAAGQLVKENKSIEKIALWIATLNAERYYNIIQGLLPEILAQYKTNKQAMDFILRKWHRAQDAEISTIAKLQERAIWFVEHSALMIGVPILGILALLLIGSMPSIMLLLIIICALAFVWFKMYPNKIQLQGINSQSPKQVLSKLREEINKYTK